jgi:hypothetical protein
LKDFGFIKYLKYALVDHRELSLPGIGTFKLLRKPAQSNFENLTLKPPQYDISFDQYTTGEKENRTFKVLKTYYPRLEQDHFSRLSSLMRNFADHQKPFYLEGLGTLDIRNGSQVFEPDTNVSLGLTKGLEEIKQKFIVQEAKISSWLEAPKSEVPNNSWFRWLPILAVACLAFGLFKLFPPSNSILKNTKKEDPKPNEILPTKPDPDTIIILDTFDNQAVKQIVDTINTSLGSSSAVKIEEVKAEDGSITKKCIIITGAYTSDKYKQLMLDKITRNGYLTYSDRIGKLTRVGLQFECEGKDLIQMLKEVRSMIVSDAWYLDPKPDKEG